MRGKHIYILIGYHKFKTKLRYRLMNNFKLCEFVRQIMMTILTFASVQKAKHQPSTNGYGSRYSASYDEHVLSVDFN